MSYHYPNPRQVSCHAAALQRRSYLVLCGILGAGVWSFLSRAPASVTTTVVCVLLEALGSAFADVVADSMVVPRARDADARWEQ